MSKSTIIIIVALWMICATYTAISRIYNLPHPHAAMIGSWVASGLLLVCIVIYVRKLKSK